MSHVAIVFQDVIYGIGRDNDEARVDALNGSPDLDLSRCEHVAIDERAYWRISSTSNFDTMSAAVLLGRRAVEED